MSERPQLTAADAEKIRQATIANIVSKIKKGGTPSAHEQRLIEEATAPASDFRSVAATTADLEECFGVTRQYLGELEAEGVIAKTAKNTWPAFDTVRCFVKRMRQRRKNQWDSGGGGDADYESERALLTKAKREAAEIATAVLKGRVHEGEAVRLVWVDMLMAARSKLLAVPKKAAPMVAHRDQVAEAERLLEEMIHEALAELADYNPQRIAEGTDLKRLNASAVPGDSEPVGSASEADGF